tara:strand:+ start:130 stop:474 length:345 start_codon:yes stop_codon:yes gene_type:complete
MSGLSLLKGIQEFRKYDTDIQSQTIVIFLYIAIHSKGKFSENGVPMTAIADELKLTQSSVSRNVSILSKVKWNRMEGLNFVSTKEDPMERRRKLVSLTALGARVYKEISEISAD